MLAIETRQRGGERLRWVKIDAGGKFSVCSKTKVEDHHPCSKGLVLTRGCFGFLHSYSEVRLDVRNQIEPMIISL